MMRDPWSDVRNVEDNKELERMGGFGTMLCGFKGYLKSYKDSPIKVGLPLAEIDCNIGIHT